MGYIERAARAFRHIAALASVVSGCGAGAPSEGASDGARDAVADVGGRDAGADDAAAGGDARDAESGDLAADTGLAGFPAIVYDGVWLIGWSGALDHYEWIRFSPHSAGAGTWIARAALCRTCDCTAAPCPGRDGTFTVVGGDTLDLELAADAGGPTVGDYRFTNFGPDLGSLFSEGADLHATVELSGQLTFDGFRFPAGHCGSDLASCPPLN